MKALVQGGQRSNPFQILLYENGSPQDAPLKQELLSSSFLPPPRLFLHITSIHLTLNQTQRYVSANGTSFIVIYCFPTEQSKGAERRTSAQDFPLTFINTHALRYRRAPCQTPQRALIKKPGSC